MSHFFTPTLQKLKQAEPQLFQFWSTLSREQQENLYTQLIQLDWDTLAKQRQLLHADFKPFPHHDLEAFDHMSCSLKDTDHSLGHCIIEQGQLACLVLAGGQGTRLKHAGPKGTYPISIIKQKSLFQLLAEKVKAAGKKAQRLLPLCLLTSPENDEETQNFFHQHAFFGLELSQVSFVKQTTLPLLDIEGKLFLKSPSEIATGPDGNGYAFFSLFQSGILTQWKTQGIQYLLVLSIDNPLADPFDAEFVGFHVRKGVDISLKCSEKTDPNEKVGVLVKEKDHFRIVEYSEISDEEKLAKRPDGSLKHGCANLNLFCFSLSFIESQIVKNPSLPLHAAWKAAVKVDAYGHSSLSEQPIAWKFETFLFDWLLLTSKVAALTSPRENCFAPLKNHEGSDSPATVKVTLQQKDRQVIERLTGLPAPSFPFELAADFHYPTESLKEKYKGKRIHTFYVEP